MSGTIQYHVKIYQPLKVISFKISCQPVPKELDLSWIFFCHESELDLTTTNNYYRFTGDSMFTLKRNEFDETKLFAFHFLLMPLRKTWINLY